MMGEKIDPKHQEWLLKIGAQVRKLRKEKAKMGYIEMSEKVGLDKKTYYNIERAVNEYNITSLMKIIDFYPKMTLSNFFKQAGL